MHVSGIYMHIFILCNSKYTVVFLHIEKCGAQNQCVSGTWVYWYKNGTSFISAWSQHALLLCNITYVIGASISEPHTCGENRKWNADTSWELLNTQTPDKYPILLVLILWGLQLVWRQHSKNNKLHSLIIDPMTLVHVQLYPQVLKQLPQ